MVQEVNADSFQTEVLESELPVIVDFWAPWCGPCRMLGPIIEELAEEFAGRVKLAKVNVDDNRELARSYGISAIPTLKMFKNGEVLADSTLVGFQPKAELQARIAEKLLT